MLNSWRKLKCSLDRHKRIVHTMKFHTKYLSQYPGSEIDYFADISVKKSGDGLSWAGAFKTLYEALDAASKQTKKSYIYVAPGKYVECKDRGISCEGCIYRDDCSIMTPKER